MPTQKQLQHALRDQIITLNPQIMVTFNYQRRVTFDQMRFHIERFGNVVQRQVLGRRWSISTRTPTCMPRSVAKRRFSNFCKATKPRFSGGGYTSAAASFTWARSTARKPTRSTVRRQSQPT